MASDYISGLTTYHLHLLAMFSAVPNCSRFSRQAIPFLTLMSFLKLVSLSEVHFLLFFD